MASWFDYTVYTFAGIALLYLVTYMAPIIAIWRAEPQDLKKKYNCEWALVTGASSGIGKSIADRLASQGINVIIAALDNDMLKNTIKEFKEKYPKLQFIPVGVDMSYGVDYMTPIIEATKGKDVRIVFNNAGYIATGFFDDCKVERQLNNLECNAIAGVKISHHFVNNMLKESKKGCIVFTSSAAAYIPSPFAAMYGSTKAFVSQFASCLGVENEVRGIDVCCIHPSPVMTNFYEGTHKMDSLDFAKLFAVNPDTLPDEIFKSIGRTNWRDLGGFSIIARLIIASMSYNFYSMLFAKFADKMEDFKKYNKYGTAGKKMD